MQFSFELAADISAILPVVKNRVRENKGKLSGDEKSGDFEGSGIAGNYSVTGRTVSILISKKPLLAIDAVIKQKITGFFRENNFGGK